jgi:predicted nucleic acid-binding Zn ribbon protein
VGEKQQMAFDFDGGRRQTPNREDLLRMGIAAAKRGDIISARTIFEQILSEDGGNERAMMWLAKLADTKAERQLWLNRVLAVNPNNQAAQEALRKMSYSRAARENRTLLIFGAAAFILFMLVLVIVVIILTTR